MPGALTEVQALEYAETANVSDKASLAKRLVVAACICFGTLRCLPYRSFLHFPVVQGAGFELVESCGLCFFWLPYLLLLLHIAGWTVPCFVSILQKCSLLSLAILSIGDCEIRAQCRPKLEQIVSIMNQRTPAWRALAA